MDFLYGLYLLFTLCCTLYVTRQYLVWSQKCITPQAKKIATIVACLLVVFLWWFQNGYRHKYSPEARVTRLMDSLLKDWETGNKRQVIVFFDNMAHEGAPWRRARESSKDTIELF